MAGLVMVAVGVLTACNDRSTRSANDARNTLRAAIDRTLAVDSLHVEVTFNRAGQRPFDRTSIDYNAPDRTHTVSTGGGGGQSITIGDTIYVEDNEQPGFFRAGKISDSRSAGARILDRLKAIQDVENVRLDGDDYVVRLGGKPPTTVTLRIEGGYVVMLRLRTGEGNEEPDRTHVYSQFGEAPVVAAPPVDRLTSAPGEVALPAPLASVQSTVQLRPVRGDAGAGCEQPEANPPANNPVIMPNGGGSCLDLAGSALEISQVELIRATTTDGLQVALDITLRTEDAQHLDGVARAHLGERLAIVFLGRIVSTPTIHGTEFGGRLQIHGLSKQDAANVKAALTG